MAIRCLVADDHPAVLKALVDLLGREDVDVVATASKGREAIEKIGAEKPDVAIVDAGFPDLSGIEVARAVGADTPVVIYTGAGEQGLLMDAFDAGARGFVVKEGPLQNLVQAVQIVAAGGSYVDGALAAALVGGAARGGLPQLTQREREVLRELADGRSYEEIGKRLFISPETVRTHVQKAMKRLDAQTKTQAVAAALRSRLIA